MVTKFEVYYYQVKENIIKAVEGLEGIKIKENDDHMVVFEDTDSKVADEFIKRIGVKPYHINYKEYKEVIKIFEGLRQFGIKLGSNHVRKVEVRKDDKTFCDFEEIIDTSGPMAKVSLKIGDKVVELDDMGSVEEKIIQALIDVGALSKTYKNQLEELALELEKYGIKVTNLKVKRKDLVEAIKIIKKITK